MASDIGTIRYFAYVRKSTEGEEKQALSIDSQKEKIKELFADLDIVEFLEERRSAFIPHNRPEFARIIERIRKGEAQGIVAWHPDRLSRNEIDAATLTYMIRTGQIKDLKFGSYHFDNSPEGIMMLQMALSHSQYSSAKLSKDVKRGLEKKVKMGWLPGVAPAGYLNTPDKEKGCKVIVKDPDCFPLVRKMWDLMLTGNYTPPQILKIANEKWGYRTVKRRREGGKPLSRSGIYKIFTNPFYYGWFEFPLGSGNWHKGSHEPMITQEEFERVQMLLGRKGKPAPHSRVFAFTGLMRCGECGCSITAEEKNQIICSNCKFKFAYENKRICPKCNTPIEKMKSPTILKYIYYHCTKKRGNCGQGCVEVKQLEKQIDEYLATIQINQKYLDWAIKHLKKSHELESSSREVMLQSQQKAYSEISKKLDKLLELRLNDEISEEEYTTKKSSLLKEKERYQELLRDTDQRQQKWLELSERTFNFSRYARFWFVEGNLQQKREILATLGSNLILKDKKLSIEAPEPFLILKNGIASVPEAKKGLEPKILPVNKGLRELAHSLNPHWLPVVDSVRTWFQTMKGYIFIFHPNST